MRRHKFKHLHAVRMRLADGGEVVYYYHRRTKKRIFGEFGSSEFLQSYLDAEKRERPIGQQTLGPRDGGDDDAMMVV